MDNYNEFEYYYKPIPNRPRPNEMRNWNYNMNTNINGQIDVDKINHDLFEPYDGFIRGNMYKGLYQNYKLNKPYDVEPMNEQANLLINIDSLNLATLDLNLYLDIYPNDQRMIELFNNYRRESNKLVGEYEKKYGPLFVNSSASEKKEEWAWDESPWPWEDR